MTPSRWWVAVTFVVLVGGVGIPYWRLPYPGLNLPDALVTPALLLVVAGALVLRLRAPVTRQTAFLTAALAVVAVVAIRIAMDLFRDATSHNLWPFEIAIAAGVGMPAAAIGVSVAGLLRRRGPG